MRMHPRYTRVRSIVTADDVPRLSNGGVALCHVHQRSVAFAGSLTEYLVKHLRMSAMNGFIGEVIVSALRETCPRCGSASRWADSYKRFKCKSCLHKYTATSSGALHSLKMPPDKMQAIINRIRLGENDSVIARTIGCQRRTVAHVRARVRDSDAATTSEEMP